MARFFSSIDEGALAGIRRELESIMRTNTRVKRVSHDKQTRVKPINRFYVGASHIAEAILDGDNDEWTRSTLEEAVEHGKQLMEDEDKELVTVVQIVRILRREKTPVTVEVVK